MTATQVTPTLTAADQETILAAVGAIREKLPFLVSLSPAERQVISKMGGKTQGFTKQAFEIAAQNPGIMPASLNIERLREVERLFESLSAIKLAIDQLQKQVNDTTMKVGSEAFAAARTIYALAKGGLGGANLKTAADELAKRFTRRSKTAPSEPPVVKPEPLPPPVVPTG